MSTSVSREQSEPIAGNASAVQALHEEWAVRRRSVGQCIAAAAAGITLAGSLVACGENVAATPEDTSTPVASTSTETAAPSHNPEAEVTPESLRIPADLPPQELAQAAQDLIVKWVMAGASEDEIPATKEARYNFDGSYDEFILDTVTKNARLYASALMSDSWTDSESMLVVRNNIIDLNTENLKESLQRYTNGEPILERNDAISNVQELDAPEGQRIVTFTVSETFENNERGEAADGTWTATYTFDVSDGTARLVDAVNS